MVGCWVSHLPSLDLYCACPLTHAPNDAVSFCPLPLLLLSTVSTHPSLNPHSLSPANLSSSILPLHTFQVCSPPNLLALLALPKVYPLHCITLPCTPHLILSWLARTDHIRKRFASLRPRQQCKVHGGAWPSISSAPTRPRIVVCIAPTLPRPAPVCCGRGHVACHDPLAPCIHAYGGVVLGSQSPVRPCPLYRDLRRPLSARLSRYSSYLKTPSALALSPSTLARGLLLKSEHCTLTTLPGPLISTSSTDARGFLLFFRPCSLPLHVA